MSSPIHTFYVCGHAEVTLCWVAWEFNCLRTYILYDLVSRCEGILAPRNPATRRIATPSWSQPCRPLIPASCEKYFIALEGGRYKVSSSFPHKHTLVSQKAFAHSYNFPKSNSLTSLPSNPTVVHSHSSKQLHSIVLINYTQSNPKQLLAESNINPQHEVLRCHHRGFCCYRQRPVTGHLVSIQALYSGASLTFPLATPPLASSPALEIQTVLTAPATP